MTATNDDFAAYQQQRKREAAAIKITDVEQIAQLPWHGNHASDVYLFDLCSNYLSSLRDIPTIRRASMLVNWHGCGMKTQPMTDAEIIDMMQGEYGVDLTA